MVMIGTVSRLVGGIELRCVYLCPLKCSLAEETSEEVICRNWTETPYIRPTDGNYVPYVCT